MLRVKGTGINGRMNESSSIDPAKAVSASDRPRESWLVD